MPENSIMSISIRSRVEAVEQRFHHQLGRVVQEERAEQQVDADDAERFLLQRVLVVEHADMDGDLAVFIPRDAPETSRPSSRGIRWFP